MISPEIFIGFTIILFALILYAWADNRNKVWGNIVGAAVATILAFVLAVSIINGNVGVIEQLPINATATVNDSVTVTLTSYGETTTAYADAGFAFFFALIGIIMAIYTLFMVYDAHHEYNQADEEDY